MQHIFIMPTYVLTLLMIKIVKYNIQYAIRLVSPYLKEMTSLSKIEI